MYKKAIKVNQNAQIIVRDGPYPGTYLTRIEDLTEDYIKIAMPIAQGQLVPISAGTKVDVLVLDYSRAYGFSSTVIQRQTFPLPMIKIQFPEKVKKVQRRNFVRVQATLSVQYYFNEYHKKEEEELPVYCGRTLDLSGGGICLFTEHLVKYGQKIYLTIQLPNSIEVKTIGKVVRTEQLGSGFEKKYKLGIQFIEINERDRDKIISYIFEIQRQLIKKGLV